MNAISPATSQSRLDATRHPLLWALVMVGTLLPLSATANEPVPPSYMQFRPSPTATEGRLSAGFSVCIANSGGVTATMQDCIGREYARLDRLLNAAYANIMRRLPNDKARAELRYRQRDWLTMRWDACLEEMDSAGGGSAGDLVYRNCQLQELVRRTLWLEWQPRVRSTG